MGHMVKSTEVMGAMNRLVKVGDIRNTMQAMQKEMMKVRDAASQPAPEAPPPCATARRPPVHGGLTPPASRRLPRHLPRRLPSGGLDR